MNLTSGPVLRMPTVAMYIFRTDYDGRRKIREFGKYWWRPRSKVNRDKSKSVRVHVGYFARIQRSVATYVANYFSESFVNLVS